MDGSPWLGLIEFGVVLMFGLAWGIMELVGLRLDRKRKDERERADNSRDSSA
jgi:hypothetical protein